MLLCKASKTSFMHDNLLWYLGAARAGAVQGSPGKWHKPGAAHRPVIACLLWDVLVLSV